MSIEKIKSVDQITVTENNTVFYRETTRILEDGVELAKQYNRTTLTPGQNLTGQPANVVAICNAVWTPEVVTKYQSALAAQTPQGV